VFLASKRRFKKMLTATP